MQEDTSKLDIEKLAKVLSEIFSRKEGVNITFKFNKKTEKKNTKGTEDNGR